MLKCLIAVAIAFGGAFCLTASAGQKLILVGGGDPPDEAVATLARWSGGTHARILVLGWSSSASDNLDYVKEELSPHNPQEIVMAPSTEEMETQIAVFFTQLEQATGLYFTGGDQNAFMAVVTRFPAVGARLRRKAALGFPVYGTSAGTAVMATTMFTGDYNSDSPKVAGGVLKGIDAAAVVLAPGLGLLRDILVDQHFFARQRQNRFWSAFEVAPESTGLGIDESTAVMLEDERWGKVIGSGAVLAVKRGAGGAPDSVFHLKAGESIDLARFRKI
jgi:cyanophycinase